MVGHMAVEITRPFEWISPLTPGNYNVVHDSHRVASKRIVRARRCNLSVENARHPGWIVVTLLDRQTYPRGCSYSNKHENQFQFHSRICLRLSRLPSLPADCSVDVR